MDILIRGMEMPKDGVYWCEIGVADDIAMITIHGEDRKSFPLVPVPPHGRLGDLDNFALLVLNWISTQEKAYPHEDSNALAWRLGAKAMANQIYRDVKAYPTIIPAEEGE